MTSGRGGIAIVRPGWLAGGAERYLLDMADGLRELTGMPVELAALDPTVGSGSFHTLGRDDWADALSVWASEPDAVAARSGDYDLFINGVPDLEIPGRAARNWRVLFVADPRRPALQRARRATTSVAARLSRRAPLASVSGRMKRYPSTAERKSMATYEHLVTVSEFSAGLIRARFGRPAAVVYPAIDATPGRAETKEQVILAVGRYGDGGNAKHHQVLVDAFRRVHAVLPAWRLTLMGSAGSSAADVAYLDRLRSRAAGLPVDIAVNVSQQELERALAGANLFWHAGGYGIPPDRPAQLEHFGIAVAEAMAAGAVPMVYAAGGPREIVATSPPSGVLWSTVDELADATVALARDQPGTSRLRERAVARAGEFAPDRFRRAVADLWQGGSGRP